MNKETASAKRKSLVKVDEKIGKQNDVILFPRKVEQAKREIAKYGLPDAVKKKQ